MAETERRRRRIRHAGTATPAPEPAQRPSAQPAQRPSAQPAQRPSAQPARRPSAQTPTVHDPEPEPADRPSVDDRETERGLRGLIGAGASQVSVPAALRARDAARPTPADLAAAETDLLIIRRGWVPRDPLAH